ncbi:hypothetical protein E2562_030908 [Oryza meyeriana var. granulata]|uniref:Uncharacterized protein n=1 Tax=Oryza meyeriana var. granulata TaxID=110450 RepID=A0A6G1E3I6_9ORYZ|nr:hypothetical protein E2562_030908 [Oryza meyeriana var. granulata]
MATPRSGSPRSRPDCRRCCCRCELTGRNADPSKYSPRAADGLEAEEGAGDDGCGGATTTTAHESGFAAAASSSSPDTAALVAAGHPAAATFDKGDGVGVGWGDYDEDDDEDDIFRSQLLDTSYSVFSPPTLLYDHPHSKV